MIDLLLSVELQTGWERDSGEGMDVIFRGGREVVWCRVLCTSTMCVMIMMMVAMVVYDLAWCERNDDRNMVVGHCMLSRREKRGGPRIDRI